MAEENIPTAEDATKMVTDALESPVEDKGTDDGGAEQKVIQARDGVHTIPYAELDSARTKAQEAIAEAEVAAEKMSELSAENEQLQSKLAEFEVAQVKDEKSGGNQHTDSFLSELQDEFPELATGLQSVLNAEREAHKAELEQVKSEIDPIKQGLEEARQFKEEMRIEAHFAAIEKAFPNYEDILESVEFQEWQKELPGYVKSHIEEILERGTAPQVIDVLEDFNKISTPGKTVIGKAREAEQSVKSNLPGTMSDIPGGSAPPSDEDEAILNMSHKQLFAKYMNMDPKKAMATVSKLV